MNNPASQPGIDSGTPPQEPASRVPWPVVAILGAVCALAVGFGAGLLVGQGRLAPTDSDVSILVECRALAQECWRIGAEFDYGIEDATDADLAGLAETMPLAEQVAMRTELRQFIQGYRVGLSALLDPAE